MRYFVSLVVVLALIGGAFMAGKKNGDNEETPKEEKKFVAVSKGKIDVTINATGKVVAHQVVEVKSKAGGEITAIHAEEGDAVTKGLLLAELDPSDEDRRVERARSDLRIQESRLSIAKADLDLSKSDFTWGLESARQEVASSEAAMKESKARFERQEALLRENAISAQELETSKSTYLQAVARYESAVAAASDREQRAATVAQREQDIALAEANVSNARIALAEAEERLAETRIVAPMDGILTSKLVAEGQVIASAISNVGGGTALLTIGDLSRLYIDASVDEVDIGQIRVGQPVVITADAYPAEQFVGKVLRVAPEGQTVNNVIVFNVRCEIEGTGLKLLKPAMTVAVSIQAGRREDALLIPINAIFYENDTAYVLRNDHEKEEKATKVYFVSGMSDGLVVEVVEGLKEGDEIKLKQTVDNRRWKRK